MLGWQSGLMRRVANSVCCNGIMRSNRIPSVNFIKRHIYCNVYICIREMRILIHRNSIENLLVDRSEHIKRRTSGTNLKNRLLKEGILENKCYGCGLSPVWRGIRLTLHLEHKNGNRNDNRLENLTVLCPNCHSQTLTYCRSKLSLYDRIVNSKWWIKGLRCNKGYAKVSHCQICGNETTQKHYRCVVCCDHARKFPNPTRERPSKEQLLENVRRVGYCGTGRLHGVSDNTIRKWLGKDRIKFWNKKGYCPP